MSATEIMGNRVQHCPEGGVVQYCTDTTRERERDQRYTHGELTLYSNIVVSLAHLLGTLLV